MKQKQGIETSIESNYISALFPRGKGQKDA